MAICRYPQMQIVNLVKADTEYFVDLPIDTRKVILQIRSGSEWKIAFKSGSIALGIYGTVNQGISKMEDNLNLSAVLRIYFSAPGAGEIMEVETWR